ncbi:uncharacterized protein PAC_01641 [Phialocephala subalpina]|uniref:N-acetyltransferase domain-containing protein n=1 Tax=Phialocephala subalpina TaxID=576137 RepID=A0A1L7WG62_9HELO|nr:uncharacterized protein PAC_01641 [Phialocephala subalpina]
MAEIKIRPALTTDLHQIVVLDLVANAQHPIIAIPWKSYSDLYGVFLSRYLNFLNYPKKFQFLVATIPSNSTTVDDPWGGKVEVEEVVGYLVGATPKAKSGKGDGKGGEGGEEWNPVLPEGTNMKLFTYFLGGLTEDKKKYKKDDHWELEGLSISANHQRKGIGARMLGQWLKEIDEDGRGVYIFASKKGRRLYEKLGAKEVGILDTELGDFGVSVPHRNFHMVREGKGA